MSWTTISLPQKFGRIWRSHFVHNVTVVSSGVAGAQVITIVLSPIITRLYGPEAFGLLGTFTAIMAVITPIAALSYPIAIVLPKEDVHAMSIAKLSVFISVGIATLLALLLTITEDQLAALLKIQEISSFLWLIPLLMVFSSFLQTLQQWLIRKKQFQIMARAGILNALIINCLKIGLGLVKPIASVLIGLTAIGSGIHAGLLAYGGKKYKKKYCAQDEDSKKTAALWIVAKKYYDFPLYRAPQLFINAISQSLPVLMLVAFFGPASAGFYALCNRLLQMPSQLIGKSVGDVFYPRITEATHNGENLTRILVKTTLALAVVGILPFGLVVTFGPWLFGFVFGAEWVIAGEYARWMAVMSFFYFLNRPAVISVPVLGLQKGLLIYEFFSTGSKFLAMYVGLIVFNDDRIFVALFSIFGALAYILLILWILISSLLREKD